MGAFEEGRARRQRRDGRPSCDALYYESHVTILSRDSVLLAVGCEAEP